MPPETPQYLTMGAAATLVLIPLLAFLGKWLLRSTEDAIRSIAADVKAAVSTIGAHTTEIALLKAAQAAQAAEIIALRDQKHELATMVQSSQARIALLEARSK